MADGQDGRIVPVMDYDLLIIGDERSLLTAGEHSDLRRRLHDQCRSGKIAQHVISGCDLDLFWSSLNEFVSNAHLSIYDMKDASIVLYGEDIRNLVAIDIEKLAVSACYYSLFRSIKSFLNQFSIDCLNSPPTGKKRFSLIFYCSKVYQHMGTQLTLCHHLYDPSSKVRVERLRENYSRLYPKLAAKVPNLPDKIYFYQNLSLFPDTISTGGIDPVALWFEARDDFELVMKYCLSTLGNPDSDDMTFLSDVLYQSLRRDYHRYFIEYFLNARYGIRNPAVISFVNRMYHLYYTHIFAMNYRKVHRSGFRLYGMSPLPKLLAISPLLLFSLHPDGSVDEKLYSAFWERFSPICPERDPHLQVPDAQNWEISKNKLLDTIQLNKKQQREGGSPRKRS